MNGHKNSGTDIPSEMNPGGIVIVLPVKVKCDFFKSYEGGITVFRREYINLHFPLSSYPHPHRLFVQLFYK